MVRLVEATLKGLKPAKLRRVAIELEKIVPRYPRPRRELEQYRTPADLAVRMALFLASRNECWVAVDLGTGTGMLAFASSILGLYAVGLDIDAEGLNSATASRAYSRLIVDFVQGDVRFLPLRAGSRFCVLMNPPFGGTRRSSSDAMFVEQAAGLSPKVIVSIHSLRSGVLEFVSAMLERLGYGVVEVLREEFPLPAQFDTHRRRVYRIPVLVIAAEKANR